MRAKYQAQRWHAARGLEVPIVCEFKRNLLISAGLVSVVNDAGGYRASERQLLVETDSLPGRE